jgi:lipoprotein NlpI
MAIPVYEKLIEVLQKDTTDENYKKWIVEAYNYLAAYEVNTRKNFAQAINYFEKVLEVDPGNDDAQKYIGILEKNLATKNAK